jgi:hypothetical protein
MDMKLLTNKWLIIGGTLALTYGLSKLFKDRINDYIGFKIISRIKNVHRKFRPARIILVRHGESEGNVNSLVYTTTQDHEINITEKGSK